MAQNFIEHVNITVSDIDRTAQMLSNIFDWQVRWRGKAQLGGNTIHVGNDQFYLAVYMPDLPSDIACEHSKGVPLNHIGIVVEDLDETERRVVAQGLTPFSHGDYAPGRRFYFFDGDGIEYEVVSYR